MGSCVARRRPATPQLRNAARPTRLYQLFDVRSPQRARVFGRDAVHLDELHHDGLDDLPRLGDGVRPSAGSNSCHAGRNELF